MRKELYSRLRDINIPGLLSLSIVGSFQDAKKIDAVTDIDIVVLVENLDKNTFKKISSVFESLANKMSSPKELFYIENRRAPVKKKVVRNKKVIQLHLLLYDKGMLEDKKNNTWFFDWFYFGTNISGKDLVKVVDAPVCIGKDVLLKEFSFRKFALTGKESAYGEVFSFKKNSVFCETVEIDLTWEEYVEATCHAIIISFLNYLRFFDCKIKKNKSIMLRKAKNNIPLEYSNFLFDIFILKDKIKNGEQISKKELSYAKKKGVEFIEYLEKRVSSSHNNKVKICAIGDPHGDLKKIGNITKDVDLYLVTGDLGDASFFRKLVMGNVKKVEARDSMHDTKIKDVKRAYQRIHDSTLDILKYLSGLAPTYSIQGNVGIFTSRQVEETKNKEGIVIPNTRKIIDRSSDMHLVKNVVRKIGGLRVGFLEYFVDEGWVKRFGDKERIGKARKDSEKARRILERFGKVDVLVCHQPPFGFLDKVSSKYGAPKKWQGKHAGSKIILDYVRKFQPRYVFCGHIHEGEGKVKIGKSEVFNLGVGGSFVFEVKDKN
ncbi:hypothetical protein HNV12_03290 [Methanococcoides sp. SA1]|nr:hypothetical protein [Methanococcoides sp. SA1]